MRPFSPETMASILLVLGCAAAVVAAADKAPLKLTVLYDNWVGEEPTAAGWGFALLIKTGTASVLFDAGTKDWVLRHNLRTLEVDLDEVDAVVLSHDHFDHTGGLFTVLERNHDVEVHIPTSFTPLFEAEVESTGASVVRGSQVRTVAEGVHVTAEMGDEIIEQALVIDTDDGLILITGCAHPGIVEMVRATKETHGRTVHTVLGGFHLMRHDDAQLAAVIAGLKELGVESAGPTHCSGQNAIDAFREAFGEHFVELGTGRVVNVE